MRRNYGGTGHKEVTVLDDDRTVDVVTVTPCCGAKYHSSITQELPVLNGKPVCLMCGRPFTPGQITRERDLSKVRLSRVTRYVS